MKAGREFDALMHMLVHDMPLELMRCRYVDGDVQPHMDYPTGHVSPKHYSTQIADAWLVVEKLAEDGFCPALIYDDNGSWTMAFDGIQNLPEDDDPLITSFCIEAKMIADTAPLAICLAALKTKENDDDVTKES